MANVDSLRYISGAVEAPKLADGKQQVMIFVRDFTGKGELPLDIKAGDGDTLRERLSAGEVVLGTNLAHRVGANVGDNITLETREGPKQLRVAATATAYMVGGMVVYMEGQTARRLLKSTASTGTSSTPCPAMRDERVRKTQGLVRREGLHAAIVRRIAAAASTR